MWREETKRQEEGKIKREERKVSGESLSGTARINSAQLTLRFSLYNNSPQRSLIQELYKTNFYLFHWNINKNYLSKMKLPAAPPERQSSQ